MSKPTFVFAHGAYHSGDCWLLVTKALELHGFKSVTLDLPGTVRNAEDKPADMTGDVTLIRETILSELEKGTNIILVCHSWGGIPGASSLRELDPTARKAAGFQTSVVAFVAISSFFTFEGESIAITRQYSTTEQSVTRRVPESGLAFVKDPGPAYYFYHDMPSEEAEKWSESVHPHSLAALLDTTKYSPYSKIPTHYLVCTEDRAIAPGLQRWLVQRIRDQGCEVRVEEIESSHSPFLSQVEKTADFLRRCAGEQTT